MSISVKSVPDFGLRYYGTKLSSSLPFEFARLKKRDDATATLINQNNILHRKNKPILRGDQNQGAVIEQSSIGRGDSAE